MVVGTQVEIVQELIIQSHKDLPYQIHDSREYDDITPDITPPTLVLTMVAYHRLHGSGSDALEQSFSQTLSNSSDPFG